MEIQGKIGSDRILSFQTAHIGCCSYKMEFLSTLYSDISRCRFSCGFINKAYSVLQMNGNGKCFICFPGKTFGFFSCCSYRKSWKKFHCCRIWHLGKSCFNLFQHIFRCCRKRTSKSGFAIIQIINQIMLHGSCLRTASIFFHDGFYIVSIECMSPSRTAISIE